MRLSQLMPSFVERRVKALKDYFGEPTSPFVGKDEEFRKDLSKLESVPLLRELKADVLERYGLRGRSLGNAILAATVALTVGFMFFDSVTDRIVSMSPWARPMFLPAFWATMVALRFFIKSVKAPQDEVDPDPRYARDEVQDALANVTGGERSLKPYLEKDIEPGISSAAAERTKLTTAASRLHSDRESLRTGRYYRNRSLTWLGRAVILFGVAFTVYVLISPFVS